MNIIQEAVSGSGRKSHTLQGAERRLRKDNTTGPAGSHARWRLHHKEDPCFREATEAPPPAAQAALGAG